MAEFTCDPLVPPVINLNGSDRHTLALDYLRAANKIKEAALFLDRHAPHPRDYPNGRFQRARIAHGERTAMLLQIARQYEEFALEIDQPKESQAVKTA